MHLNCSERITQIIKRGTMKFINNLKSPITIALCLVVALFFQFCNPFAAKKENNDDQLTLLALLSLNRSISQINFDVVSGSEKVSCSGNIPGTIANTTGSKLKDLRFYVHDIKLIRRDGSKVDFTINQEATWQIASGSNSFGSYSGVALLDFEDATNSCVGGTTDMNKSVRGSAPIGEYTGVEFKLGVPFFLNHMTNTTASAPLNSSAMYWAWNSGYKFSKIEFIASSTNQFHLGSQLCSGNTQGPVNTCGRPNLPTISISGSTIIDLSSQSITLDIAKLYNGSDASGTGINTCMAGNGTAACQPIITNLGLDTNGQSTLTQTTFSLK